ncbi:MAG: 30S ribosomal protein S21 [Ignavibacteria bacterium]|nr:30S ribosomal protein S21 [Ignavibacteria bacterium]
MLIIKVEKELELALKKYKNKVRKTKLMEQLKDRMFNEKKSVKRRKILIKAKYRQQVKNNE